MACSVRHCALQASKIWGPDLGLEGLTVLLLLQVFMAVLVRGYAYTPQDVQEPWTTWPVGGYPVNGMPLHLEKL